MSVGDATRRKDETGYDITLRDNEGHETKSVMHCIEEVFKYAPTEPVPLPNLRLK